MLFKLSTNKFYIKGFVILFILSATLYISSLIGLYNYIYYAPLPDWYIKLSILDYVCMIFVIYVFFIKHNKYLTKTITYINNHVYYLLKLKTSRLLLLMIIAYLVFKMLALLPIALQHGISRRDFFYVADYSRFLYVAIGIIISLSALSLNNKLDMHSSMLSLLAFICITIIFMSRSEIMSVLLLSMLIYFIFNDDRNNQFLGRLCYFLILLLLLFVSVVMYVKIQNRAPTMMKGFLNTMEHVVKYRSNSHYLGFILLQDISFNDIFFVFLGYPAERIFVNLGLGFAKFSEGYISATRYIGPNTMSNVLYPWWTFFYGIFGIMGIFIKNIYMYFILKIIFKYELYLSAIYFTYICLFYQMIRHPMSSSNHFYMFIGLIVFDMYAKRYISKMKTTN